MLRRKTAVLIVAVLLAMAALTLNADDSARELWIDVKCALCHGVDGASDTSTGRKTNAPDLRTEQIQNFENDELDKRIHEGHAKMPSFKRQLTDEEVKVLVLYIREFGEKTVKVQKGGS